MAILKSKISESAGSEELKFSSPVEFLKPYIKDWGLIAVLILLVLASSGTAYYYYSQASALKENPQKIAQTERAALVAQVSQLIVLPNEDPTMATVSNIDVLRNQPFFANAKNGDKVLIYANARKAILYDPDADKIVEVSPINIGNPAPQPSVPESKKK